MSVFRTKSISDIQATLSEADEVHGLKRTLGARHPASLEVCALLTKPERREVDVPVRYIGFEIPNRFVVGYGLDFAERYRNLRYVGVLADEAAGDTH